MSRRLGGALAVAAALGLSACGGGGDDDDVRALLDTAFNKPIPSAIVTADVEVEVEGIDELSDPLRLQVTGPYRGGEGGRLPAFDWDVGFSGGGQTVSGGLLSTSENVFVNLQGTDYEVGEDAVGEFNRRLAEAGEEGEGRSLAQFGIDPSNWLGEPEDEGDETVAGIETTHVKARIDVGRLLDDLNVLVERAGGAVPGQVPAPRLTEEQQRDVEQVVGEPVLDVYVGKEDQVVRRLAATLDLDVPEGSRDEVGGIEGGRISFSIEFAEVGAPVEIAAPRRARRLDELASQLGGLVGGDGDSSGGGEDGSPFDRYAQCLEEADPSRVDEIEACSELLR